jgi:hypothetical protein
MSGPFATEREARELPAVRAVYTAFEEDPGAGKMTPPNLSMLEDVCVTAGVELGAYDRRILAWLANYEPQMCAVICGLISRANRAASGVTADDRKVMDRARGIASAYGTDELRAWFRSRGDETTAKADTAYLYGCALGAAQHYLSDALNLIEQIAGQPHPASTGGQL